MKKITTIFLLSISIFFVLILSQVDIIRAEGNTLYVDDDNDLGPWDGTQENPYNNIQDAIHSSDINDTIIVHHGNYSEELFINKPLILTGSGKSYTTIKGDNTEILVNISADYVIFSGFSIESSNIGIKLVNCSFSKIRNCTIKESEVGIYIDSSSENNSIYNNNILKNTKNAHDMSYNFWYKNSKGNYWDDYNGQDLNKDNIGDSPYDIPGGTNKDEYPLIKPITQSPLANFTFYPINPTTQDNIQFNDTSIDPDGYIESWLWDFGDGNNSTVRNPEYKYEDDGIYNVTLTVHDDYGVKSVKKIENIILNVKPIPDFSYYPELPTDIESVKFSCKSYDLDGNIINWFWDFGDGNISSEKNVTHMFIDDGVYNIILNVTDDDGAINEIIKQITILNVPPVAMFNYKTENLTPVINEVIHFADKSIDQDGEIISWFWEFGEGTTSTKKNPDHSFSKKGTYLISLKVTDNDNDEHIKTQHLTVLKSIKNDESDSLIKGLSLFDIFFLIFLLIMVSIVIIISKKYR